VLQRGHGLLDVRSATKSVDEQAHLVSRQAPFVTRLDVENSEWRTGHPRRLRPYELFMCGKVSAGRPPYNERGRRAGATFVASCGHASAASRMDDQRVHRDSRRAHDRRRAQRLRRFVPSIPVGRLFASATAVFAGNAAGVGGVAVRGFGRSRQRSDRSGRIARRGRGEAVPARRSRREDQSANVFRREPGLLRARGHSPTAQAWGARPGGARRHPVRGPSGLPGVPRDAPDREGPPRGRGSRQRIRSAQSDRPGVRGPCDPAPARSRRRPR
jgi:hypothetical protein